MEIVKLKAIRAIVIQTVTYNPVDSCVPFNKAVFFDASVTGLNFSTFGNILIINKIIKVSADHVKPPKEPVVMALDKKINAITKSPKIQRQKKENIRLSTAAF
jgi:hypothetical protein